MLGIAVEYRFYLSDATVVSLLKFDPQHVKSLGLWL